MSQPPLSPTQPDLSPGTQPTADNAAQRKRKQQQSDDGVLAESSSSNDGDRPLTQRAPKGPGPLTRRYYSKEEIEKELLSIHEHIKEINAHIKNLEDFLKLH